MKPRLFALVCTLSLTALTAGCNHFTSPGETPQIGFIMGMVDDQPAIQVPVSAAVGETFTVSITTLWRNTCVRRGGTRVEVQGMTATITPYDVSLEIESTGCGQAITPVDHSANIRFDKPGTATVVIVGRDAVTKDVVSVSREVVMQ